MTLSTELIISLVIQLVSIGIFIGVFKATVSFMQQQIEDIKTTLKDDKQELKEEMRKAKADRTCANCGAAIEENTVFCPICGQKLEFTTEE